jgi:tetratricopeptide (TPR) repeat protein
MAREQLLAGGHFAGDSKLKMRLLVTFTAVCLATAAAQQSANQQPLGTPQHEANFDAERKQANDLFLAGEILKSLPLYEDLCRQDQTIAVFAERHGAGLLRKASTVTDPAAHKIVQEQAIEEIRRAVKLGDNSAYVQTILSAGTKSVIGSALSGLPLSVGYLYHGSAQAQPVMIEAEATFGREDVPSALKLYLRAAQMDPKWYDPALYAGDMYFRQGDTANAAVWYAKAIAIDPDRDTAYRYWGDALMKAGKPDEARVKFEQAFVAEPYSKPGWLSFLQWARQTKTPVVIPQVALPKFTVNEGKLVPDPALATEGAKSSGRAAWTAYETCRVKHAPVAGATSGFAVSVDGSVTPTGSYHSLGQETECLQTTLVDLRARMADGSVPEQSLDPSLKMLLQLEKDGVLPCWLLLNAADQGIRFDYPAYRKTHRDDLVVYVDRYLLRRAP